MPSLQTIKNQTLAAVLNDDILALQMANVGLLQQEYPHYGYHQFCADSARATAPLTELEQLVAYQSFYAVEHYHRFEYMLQSLAVGQCQQDVVRLKIFDYGCGQGLASLAFLQRLKNQNKRFKIEIHLIEPSSLALELARFYIEEYSASYFDDVQVVAHCCGIDALPASLFQSQQGQYVVHLFSNTLDLVKSRAYCLRDLVRKWYAIEGQQFCLAVSPQYSATSYGFDRLTHLLPSEHISREGFSITCRGYRFFGSRTGICRHTVKGEMLFIDFNFDQDVQQEAA